MNEMLIRNAMIRKASLFSPAKCEEDVKKMKDWEPIYEAGGWVERYGGNVEDQEEDGSAINMTMNGESE